jgi:hypothetical protein
MYLVLTKFKSNRITTTSALEVFVGYIGKFTFNVFLGKLTLSQLQVKQAILGIHGVDVQFIGVNFLEYLVNFNLSIIMFYM